VSNSAWGLPAGHAWDLYRWYPDSAKLSHPQGAFGSTASIALRPFEIVLLEAVPHGQIPTRDRRFEMRPIPAAFAEPSRSLDLAVEELRLEEKRDADAIWTVLDPTDFASAGGATLRKLSDRSLQAAGDNPSPDTYTITASTELSGINGFRLEVLSDPSLPCGGPGRAINGNFALNQFSITASPRNGEKAVEPHLGDVLHHAEIQVDCRVGALVLAFEGRPVSGRTGVVADGFFGPLASVLQLNSPEFRASPRKRARILANSATVFHLRSKQRSRR
jgi:hypothetical protein